MPEKYGHPEGTPRKPLDGPAAVKSRDGSSTADTGPSGPLLGKDKGALP